MRGRRNGVELDCRIWSGLPDHMWERILARLPPQSLLRFRSVCKRWKRFIDSAAFMDLCSTLSASTPWLLMFKRQECKLCRAYDSFHNKWHTLPLPFLPHGVGEVVAVSQGLLCFRFGGGGGVSASGTLVVCNPLKKTWKQLPPMLFSRRKEAIAMVVERDSTNYKIVVAGGSHFEIFDTKTEVFESATNAWKRIGDLPPRIDLGRETAYCDGKLYFTTAEPDVILAYSLEQEIWKKVQAPLPPSLTCARLVVTQGLVFLVGGVGTHGISRTLCLWQLRRDRTEWIEVQKIPEMMCRKFLAICYHTYEHICCIGHEDYICLTCFTSPEILVYKISRQTWHWLPQCPLIPDKSSGGFTWFSFYPNLYSTP